VEEWKSGRVEEWKSGRVEEWKSGRVEEWKSGIVAHCVAMSGWNEEECGEHYSETQDTKAGLAPYILSFFQAS